MRSNKDRKLNLGTAFRLTLMNKFVKKNLDVKIHKLCNLANTEEIQCRGKKECRATSKREDGHMDPLFLTFIHTRGVVGRRQISKAMTNE